MKLRKVFYYSLAGIMAAGLAGIVFLSSYVEADEGTDDRIRLIVRGDDMGSCHAINVACIKSYRDGIMRTVEVMVPCPWFEEAAKMLRENPGLDVGVHLTLTSEWDNYKWRPLTCAPTLVDEDGYFYPQTKQWGDRSAGTGFLDAKPDLEEVEKELRAQIELAKKKIPQLSHLSAHMKTAISTPELIELTIRLAKEYDLYINFLEYGAKLIYGIGKGTDTPEQREAALIEILENLKPGLWLLIEHPGVDTPEMMAIGHPGYEHVAKDRDGVTKAFASEKVKEVIKNKAIELISYRDLKKYARPSDLPPKSIRNVTSNKAKKNE